MFISLFRNFITEKLELQTHFYALQNSQRTEEAIKILLDAVEGIVVNGYNSFEYSELVDKSKNHNIPDSVTFALELNKNTLKKKVAKILQQD